MNDSDSHCKGQPTKNNHGEMVGLTDLFLKILVKDMSSGPSQYDEVNLTGLSIPVSLSFQSLFLYCKPRETRYFHQLQNIRGPTIMQQPLYSVLEIRVVNNETVPAVTELTLQRNQKGKYSPGMTTYQPQFSIPLLSVHGAIMSCSPLSIYEGSSCT